VRLALLEQCAPLLTDAVICGHDHDFIAALAWLNVAACQQIAPELATLDAAELVRHPIVVVRLQARLRDRRPGGASLKVERLLPMAEPPSVDANEIADKGYVNQAVTRARRAHLVDELYHAGRVAHIACA
jgi:feruloyl-CoA synthase